MTQKKKVAFIELTVFSGVYPLASGYMRAVAEQSVSVRTNFDFEINSICINDKGFEEELGHIEADVFAISCYVWNMGFIKRWLPELIARFPDAHIILGGPQVIKQGERYLIPEVPNLVLCNGEGEYTFTAYLTELVSVDKDLNRIKGLTFYAGNELVTTESQPRIKDLSMVPSPYLEGYLDPSLYVWASIETNRGCPYECTYCFWGAATNARVFKNDLDRVKAEITWLAQNRSFYLFITDANFGMLRRDIEIAQHLADCKEEYGYPLTVFFSSAKNAPERVTELTKILSSANLISTQPVSLQTMDLNTLESVKRSNIKDSSYLKLQDELHKNQLSSFIEMIWPLPGETLDSFKSGLARLCSSDADAFVIHHLLLINNVEMNEQREEYQLEVTDDADPNSEAQVVIATKDVSHEEYKEGVRFGYHVTSLYSLRTLRMVGQYIDKEGILSFKDLLSAFSDFCNERPEHPYMQYINDVIEQSGQTQFSANGGIFHVILHQHRQEFDQLLMDFMNSLNLLKNEHVRFLFELDLLNKPHVYSNTPVVCTSVPMQSIKIESHDSDGIVIKVPDIFYESKPKMLNMESETVNEFVKIKYRTNQMPFMENKALEDNLSYCEAKLHKMGSILPIWAPLEHTS